MSARTLPGLSTHLPVFYKFRKLDMCNHFQGTDFLVFECSTRILSKRARISLSSVSETNLAGDVQSDAWVVAPPRLRHTD